MLTYVELAGVRESKSSWALTHAVLGEEHSYFLGPVYEEIGLFTELLLIFVSMQGSPFVFKDNTFENVTKYV